jgi:short-subunit dehydrogenase
MPLAVHTLIALVHEFLPAMLARGSGAILSAQGASAVHGIPNLSGPGPALAAARNYLQSLAAEVADHGVYVGQLYIGASILHSAFYLRREALKASGVAVAEVPSVDPDHLADVLWTMHGTRTPMEVTYPEVA